MNILIVDIEQMGLPFALRCAEAGHSVKLYRHMPRRKERYAEGFKEVALVDDWRPHMQWAREGLIVNTGNFALLHELDRWREYGYPIFGPTVQSAKIEIDRLYGMKIAEGAGLAVPEYHVFNSLQETEKFVRKSDKPWVFKPAGDEENKALTYVASDPEDMVAWLTRQIKAGKEMKQCLLQEKIEVLSELGISGWFGPEGCPPIYGLSIEHKKLMSGEVGPTTGEMGTVHQWVESDDKLNKEVLEPFESIMIALGHRGDFSIGTIIDTSGKAWFLETTARFGYPAWAIQMASIKGDPAKWMKDLMDGKDSLKVSYDVAVGVVIPQPPFPYQHYVPAELVNMNKVQIEDGVKDQIHLCSVEQEKGELLTTGPYVCVATGMGKTISKARNKAYRAVDGVKFPDRMYRDDIGCKVIDALPKLHSFGYALDMQA